MGIQIDKYDAKSEQITYRLVPEKLDISALDYLKFKKRETLEGDKFRDRKKHMRLIGEVPYEFMYNWALSQGCPANEINDFYNRNNAKNMKRLLKEFECFRMVDKL